MSSHANSRELTKVGERVKIYPNGPRGNYVADFHFKGHRRVSLKTRNKKVAVNKAKLIDAQLINGTYANDKAMSQSPRATGKQINEAVLEYIAWHKNEGRRRRTHRRYQGILDIFTAFLKRKKITKVEQIKLRQIDDYRAERNETLAPRTMHNEAQVLQSFLQWCEEREYIERSPLYKRKFRRPKPKARKAPTLAIVEDVLEAVSAARMPQLAMLAFTGMRSGELRNLRAEDVDLEAGWIHIVSRPGHETKNGESRKVPIHPRLRAILEKLPRHKSGWFFRALPSNKYPAGDHHINPKRLNEDFQKILVKLGLPTGRDEGFTAHSLRRFFRTTTVNSNVPERVVDLWIGHRDTKQMGTIYYDLSDEKSQEFMQQVEFGESDSRSEK